MNAYIFPGLPTTNQRCYRYSLIKGGEWKSELILDEVCKYFEVEKIDVVSPSRLRELVIPRQIAMHFIRQKTHMYTTKIGEMFGRDHSTVIYACQQVENLKDTDKRFASDMVHISAVINKFI